MNLRARLRRLERKVHERQPAPPPGPDLFARLRGLAAYLAGQGPRPPDPPCPPRIDPAAWARRLLVGRCLDARLPGELGPGEYLPGLGDDARGDVDRPAEACGGRPGPAPGTT
jgi:hypothetical protein